MNEARAPQSFLVTGATGFIGAHLTRELARRFTPSAVTALVHSRRRPGENAALEELRHFGVRIIECDVLELPRADLRPPAFDAVIHLAATAEPENPRADFSVNDMGTRNLIEWLGQNLRGKRFLFTSTLACVDRDHPREPITETTPCTPRTPYGITKLKAEHKVRARRADFGYDFTILRLCTIIGPGFRPAGMFGICPRLLARRAMSARLNWPGRSSFLGIRDLVRVLIEVSAHPQAANETFVVSNGENPPFDSVLDAIAAVHGLSRQRISLPAWLWKWLGAVLWPLARCPLTPPRQRITLWRAANVIHDGICADGTRLNKLIGGRYQSVLDALREAYGK